MVRRCPRPAAPTRLLCFPYSGGGVTTYHLWGDLLGKQVEVAAVQLPGRDLRAEEAPEVQVERLVERLGAGLEPLMQGRFAFFGHSLGALLAFELTRWLRAEGRALPEHLFLSGFPAPPRMREVLHHVVDVEGDVLEGFDRAGLMPELLKQHPDLLEMVAPVLRADGELLRGYRYRSQDPLESPVTVFTGRQDPVVPLDSTREWESETRGALRRCDLPGDHLFVNTQRFRITGEIARDLRP